MRIALPLGWVVVAALALFSVAGTRDYLVFMRAVWAMGEEAVRAGVPLDRLDAGSAWDGYHLYEYGLENQHPLAHAERRAVVGLLLRARHRFGLCGGGKATHQAITSSAKTRYSSWLQRRADEPLSPRRWGTSWPLAPIAKQILTLPAPAG